MCLRRARRPVRPPLPGIDLPGIFVVRTVPDSRRIREWIDQKNAKSAVIIGAGFIGLEMAENLVRRGLSVTIVEMLDQVMPPLDAEMARPVQEHLESHGVRIATGDRVAGFETAGSRLVVNTQSGVQHPADMVILAIGVRPETALAKPPGSSSASAGAFGWTRRCVQAIPRSGRWAMQSR